MMNTITLEGILETINQIKSANVDEIMNEMRAELSSYDVTLDEYSTARREMEQVQTEVMAIISGVMPEDITSKIASVFDNFSEFMKNIWLDSVSHKASNTTMAHFKYTIEEAKEAANTVYNYYMQLA